MSQLDSKEYKLERWEHYPALPRIFGFVLAVILIVVLIAGTAGNTAVLVLFSKYKSLRTSFNIFVVNQAVSDLFMCVLCLPILIANCFRGHYEPNTEYILCKVDASVAALTGFVSIWSLVALAFDRFIVIRRNFPAPNSANNSTICASLAGIWILCVLCSALPFMGIGRYVLEGSNMSCTFDYFTRTSKNIIYNIFIQIAFFGIPMICIIFCYGSIFLNVKQHERRYFGVRKSGTFSEESFRRMRRNRNHERNEMKTARAGLILIAVFCFSWLPYSLVALIGLFGDSSWISPIFVTLPVFFAKMSTVLNPVIYALVNKRFKSKLSLFVRQYFKITSTRSSSDGYELEEKVAGNSRRSYLEIRHGLQLCQNCELQWCSTTV